MRDDSILQGRVAIVTGGGNGIGRGEAIALARSGASVLVNDLGVRVDGTSRDTAPADRVVDEIRRFGGGAVPNYDDVGDWTGAGRIVEQAIAELGGLDIVVNNAGVQLPGGLIDISEAAWDTMLRVHLRATAAMMHHSARHWRDLFEAGRDVSASIINTTSPAALPGDPGMPAYAAAKAGIAALTVASAQELRRYGIRVNAVAPFGFTRLVAYNLGQSLPTETAAQRAAGFDPSDPENNAPLVVWLASDLSRHVTGQVFRSKGGSVTHYEPWRAGVTVSRGERWTPAALGEEIDAWVFGSRPRGRRPEPEIEALSPTMPTTKDAIDSPAERD